MPILLLLLALAACGAPTHPLTYVHPGDPVWQINPPDPEPLASPSTPQRQATR